MVVVIESKVFQAKECFDTLDKIIDLFVDKRHQWSISNAEAILASDWLKGEKDSRLGSKASFLVKQAVQTLYINKTNRTRAVTIVREPAGEREYDIDDAFGYLSEPVYLVVENLNSDRAFITTLFEVFNIKELKQAYEKRWIQFDSEGGTGGAIRRINFHIEKKCRPNLLIILDSDLQLPEQEHNDKTKEICKKCSDNAIGHFVFKKRAIENYIPLPLLFKLPENLQHVVEAYNSLSDVQKDFYDLKKGFGGKGDIPDGQKDLFQNIDKKSEKFKALRNGFGIAGYNSNNLHQCFLNKEMINKEMLLERCLSHPQELEMLMDNIKILL